MGNLGNYSLDQMEAEIEKINQMTHIELARIYRYAHVSHPYFCDGLPFRKIFMERFRAFGGMTKQMVDQLPWRAA